MERSGRTASCALPVTKVGWYRCLTSTRERFSGRFALTSSALPGFACLTYN